MGTVLREKFNCQILGSIRSAYIQAFDASHTAVREAILQPALTILAATRNVSVHRAEYLSMNDGKPKSQRRDRVSKQNERCGISRRLARVVVIRASESKE